MCFHDPTAIHSASGYIEDSGGPLLSASVCLFPTAHSVKNSLSISPCWTSHLKDCVYDLFRSSSGEIFLWNSAKVPALQCLVNSMNEGVNHLSHVTGEWVEGGPLGPRALEMPVLVALGTKQSLLAQSDV